jgi:hypothetical protein
VAPHRISWEATKKGSEGLGEHERELLGKAVHTSLETDAIKVMQVATADIDADGTSEIFISVVGSDFDPVSGKGQAGLFFLRHGAGGAADVVKPVRTSSVGVYRVEGTVDLDGDGTRELWISERRFHPNGSKTDSMVIERPTAQGFESVGDVETCWPRPKGAMP